VIVLWAALVVALTAAAYSVTWDLCNAGGDEFDVSQPRIEQLAEGPAI
jgi:hypothetical protein